MKLYYVFILLFTEIAFCLEPDEDLTSNHIVFSNEEIKLSGGGASLNDTTVVIENPGSFLVTGKSEEGNIVIKSSSVTLFLLDLYLTSEKTAPIIVTSNLKNVKIYIKKTTTLNDFEEKSTTEGECAVVKIKKNSIVSFKNDASVEMNGNCRDAIKGGKDTKIIFEKSDGEYIINSKKTSIDSEGLIQFNGGKFKIVSEKGDAIKSSPTDTDKTNVGIILINNGKFNIKCLNDAFTAKNNIVINNGKFNITTENGFKSKTFDKTESAKGFKLSNNDTGCGMYIYSGDFYLNTSDDAFHSNGDLTILSGIFKIYTKDDAICSKKDLVLGKKNAPNDELKINVENSYEALEGVTITIYSGTIRCNSKDDGMNASGDKSEEIEKDRKKKEQEQQNKNKKNNNTDNSGRNNTGNTGNNNRTRRNDSNWSFPNRNNSGWNWPNGNNSGWNWPNGNNSGWNWPNRNNSGWNFPGGNNNNSGFDWSNWNYEDSLDWDEIRRTHVSGAPNDRYIIRIFGGDLFFDTNSDGIDSNGHIYIHGGNIDVFSVGHGYNEPIDLSGNFSLFNAEVLNVGAGGVQLVHDALSKGNQMYAFRDGKVTKNKKLEIRDENGKVVKQGEITKDINYIFYSSPQLNEKYTFYVIDDKNNEQELKFVFGNPEKGLDDLDTEFDYKDIKVDDNKNKAGQKVDEIKNNAKYLTLFILGIYLLLL